MSTTVSNTDPMSSPLRDACLYGVDQSPWVAGVRVAFEGHGVPLTLTSTPHGVAWFWRNGLIFPALRLAGGGTHLDSFRMYALLESSGYDVGFARVGDEAALRFQVELERLFATYVMGRCGIGRNIQFVDAWSRMRDEPFAWRGLFVRALVVHYFHVLIHLGRWRARRRGREPFDLERCEAELRRWDARLEDTEWFTGDRVGFLDYAVFGHMQCMTSGLTDMVLPVLQSQPRLMDWMGRMITLYSGHEPLYVRRLFGGTPRQRDASTVERAVFWMAWLGWLVALPVTAGVVGLAIFRRSGNPAHSGAVSRRARRAASGA